MTELVEHAVKEKLNSEKDIFKRILGKSLEEENSAQLKTLQDEMDDKSTKLKELIQTKAEVLKLKREKDELRDEIVLEKEKELTERLQAEKQIFIKQLEDEKSLKIEELKK